MDEKVVDFTVDGKPTRFVFRKLTYGQRNECLRRSTRVNAMTKQIDVDPYLFNEERLVMSIASPSEWRSIDKVRSLEPEIGDKMIELIDELNGLNPLPNDSSATASPKA